MHKRAFLVWLSIYPLITALFYVLGEYLSPLPLALRTFVLTIIAVPLVSYLIMPFFNKVFAKWLRS